MMSQTPATLQRYSDSIEHPESDEADTIRELIDAMTSISKTTLNDSGHAMRGVHAKSHGLIDGELEVISDLPEPLAQGLFAKPGKHKVAMRLSTSPGDILPDSISTPRGLAIKVMDVDGDRLSADGARSQDFVMVNGPAFSVPTPKKFLGNVKLLAKTTDRPEGLKQVLASALQVAEKVLETFGGESPLLKSLGGHPETNVLCETFFTQVPVRYGDYIAKLSLVPVSPELVSLKDAPVDVNSNPDGLRQAVIDFFGSNSARWDLRVQLCTDLETMPIEDASVVWPTDKSSYITVASLTAPPQPAWDNDKIARINEGLSFSPWHGVAAHRPLGGIMRARRDVYEAGVKFRKRHGARVAA